jgi:hypothetical protein
MVGVIEPSDKEQIHATVHNTFLDDLPPDIPGVTTALNEIEVNNWLEHTKV